VNQTNTSNTNTFHHDKWSNNIIPPLSVWQLMRKYTLSLLSKLSPDGTPIVETEILTWVNQRLDDAKKGVKVRHFQDQVNKTALPVCHLIDAMRAGVIDYNMVNMTPTTKEVCQRKQVGAPPVPSAVFRGSIKFEDFWCQRHVKVSKCVTSIFFLNWQFLHFFFSILELFLCHSVTL
jgi:hypothetical protein